MTNEKFDSFAIGLMTVMQVSIVVPMVVVWCRKRHFSAAVRRLSLYVYISAFFVVVMKVLYPAYIPDNYWLLMGFNCSKIVLFGLVYHQVLRSERVRRLVAIGTGVAVMGILAVFLADNWLGVSVSRIVQCALLAAFAIAYLEQTLTTPPVRSVWQSPMGLLSVGQLLYSAGTVTAFSLEYLTLTIHDQSCRVLVIAVVGMAFNGFLTLAFLRAKRQPFPVGTPAPVALGQLMHP